MQSDESAAPPKAHTLRLLLPFFFEREAVSAAVGRLVALCHMAKKPWPCWTAAVSAPDLYRDETLPNIRDFLFGGGAGGCAYLRVPDETTNTWFKSGGAFVPCPNAAGVKEGERPGALEVRLAAPGIELFLSPHGAGLFSLAFEPQHCIDAATIQDLNYRLSQIRSFTAWCFRLPHGAQDPNAPPAFSAPLADRLGRRGGVFRLIEWVEFLLEPLAELGYRRLQDQFSVYSVTRLGAAADFADPAVVASLRPFLTALAHVEEWGHVGSLAVTEGVLNPRHWAAVGSLGAAHLVADQNPPRPFDAQRLPTVLHKYFIPYLVSLLQRVALQRLLGEARSAFASEEGKGADQGPPGSGLAERLRRLNLQSLALTVNGCFTEVSSREVLNQYYELVQNGLRVADSFGTLQRALRDAEVMDNDRFQGSALTELGALAGNLKDLLVEAGNSARIVAHVQSKVEWLEVFFVSYYFTALMYYVSHGSPFSNQYNFWSLVLAPAVSGGIAFFGLTPHKLHGKTLHGTQPVEAGIHAASGKARAGHAWGFLVWLVAAFVLWLALGFAFFAPEKAPQTSETTTAAAPVQH